MGLVIEFLVFSLATIIASFIVTTVTGYYILKDMADAGYKFNNIWDLILPLPISKMLTPGLNLYKVFNYSFWYIDDIYDLFLTLKEEKFISEMSNLEIKEYMKNPTALNAFLAPIRVADRLELEDSIQINIKGIPGKIVYKTDSTFENIVILEASGIAKNLSVYEQKKEIRDAWAQFAYLLIRKFDSIENIEKKVEDNVINIDNIFDLASEIEDTQSEDLNPSISEKKEELEKLRSKLYIWFGKNLELEKNDEQKNDGPRLVK